MKIVEYLHSSECKIFGINYFSSEGITKKILKPFYCTFHFCSDISYWFKYRFIKSHQYHIVRTKLTPGYYDVDEIMFQSCFTLLGRFVEEELGTQEHEDSYRGYRLHSTVEQEKTAIDLWYWFNYELPALESFELKNIRAFNELYGYYYIQNLKQTKLEELIKIRRSLWT